MTERVINDSNPLPSYEDLDPRVRLDLAEIHSRNGFKSYDYIPISQESLQRTWGEVIPSLNAVPVEGVGDTSGRLVNGQRTSKYRILTQEEVESILRDIEEIEADPSIFRFNQDTATGFSDTEKVINVGGDVLPDLSSTHRCGGKLIYKKVSTSFSIISENHSWILIK